MDKRRKIQWELALEGGARGEAPKAPAQGIESTAAGLGRESQADTDKLMEEACEKENLRQALRRVKANTGAAGVDGMSVQQLPDYLRENWARLKEQLLSATYRPQPVRRVEITKAGGGGRKLAIPVGPHLQ
jgi:RNA-directed DNA polymerase